MGGVGGGTNLAREENFTTYTHEDLIINDLLRKKNTDEQEKKMLTFKEG